MLMLARELVSSGRCRNILVVAGENRLSGQSRDSAIQTLAQVDRERGSEPEPGAQSFALHGVEHRRQVQSGLRQAFRGLDARTRSNRL
jgi:hypothetical protein